MVRFVILQYFLCAAAPVVDCVSAADEVVILSDVTFHAQVARLVDCAVLGRSVTSTLIMYYV